MPRPPLTPMDESESVVEITAENRVVYEDREIAIAEVAARMKAGVADRRDAGD